MLINIFSTNFKQVNSSSTAIDFQDGPHSKIRAVSPAAKAGFHLRFQWKGFLKILLEFPIYPEAKWKSV